MNTGKNIISKTTQVADILEKEIRAGKFRPGEKLPSMRTLASRFNVSVKVLYEVAIRLEKLGLCRRSARSGIFIPDNFKQQKLCVLITTVSYGTIDHYFEALMHESCEANSVTMISYTSERSVKGALEKKPVKIFADISGHDLSLQDFRKMTSGVETIFFNRFEWVDEPPVSAVLTDWNGITEQTLRHFLERGHKRIAFISHEKEIMPFKRIEITAAAKKVGLKFDSPEFQWFGATDFDENPSRIMRIFKEDPPTAVFARSDMILSKVMSKVSVFFPQAQKTEKIGCFDLSYSKHHGGEFSTWRWDWMKFWKMAFAHTGDGVEYYRPEFIFREPETF